MSGKGKRATKKDPQVSDLSSFENGGDVFYYREDWRKSGENQCFFKNI